MASPLLLLVGLFQKDRLRPILPSPQRSRR